MTPIYTKNHFPLSADLCHLASVATMADDILHRFPRLNVLVLNAGVLQPQRQMTRDGYEMTFQVRFIVFSHPTQVNHLSQFYLCERLLPQLTANAPSKVIIVSSICHSW